MTPNIQFAEFALDQVEKRRSAVENKASILIASNAIILAGLSALIPSLTAKYQPTGGATQQPLFVVAPLVVAVVTLVAAVVSIILATGTIATVFSDRARGQLLDLSADSRNLLYFKRIADRTMVDYSAALSALDEQAMLTQLATEIYNISRFLCWRYQRLKLAHTAFVVSVAFFMVTAVAAVFAR